MESCGMHDPVHRRLALAWSVLSRARWRADPLESVSSAELVSGRLALESSHPRISLLNSSCLLLPSCEAGGVTGILPGFSNWG